MQRASPATQALKVKARSARRALSVLPVLLEHKVMSERQALKAPLRSVLKVPPARPVPPARKASPEPPARKVQRWSVLLAPQEDLELLERKARLASLALREVRPRELLDLLAPPENLVLKGWRERPAPRAEPRAA